MLGAKDEIGKDVWRFIEKKGQGLKGVFIMIKKETYDQFERMINEELSKNIKFLIKEEGNVNG